jgi:predicted phage tail protein
LAWSDVANETGYKLEVKNSAGAWTDLATLGADVTTFNHDGLNASTAYTYRISAFNAAGSSPLSAELTVTTQPPLQPPTAPTLSTTGNSHSTITLAWSDVANETGYKLEVKNSAGAWTELATLGADVTTFNHDGLNASTAYTYRISAFNAAGSSPLSAELTVTTEAPPLQPPAQPVLGGTVASHTSLNLGWGEVANATEFRLERRLANSTTWAEVARISVGTTNHVDTGLSASTAYVYRLRAFNAAGFSAYSEELTLTTAAPPLQPPVAPVLQAQALSHAQVALSWTAVENETGFTLQRRDGTGESWISISSPAADVTSYIDTQVRPLTTYAYRIAATNAAGSSGYSAEVNVTTPVAPVLPPASPSLQATAISPTEVRLQWSDVANELNYIIEGRLDGGTVWTTVTSLDANTTSFTDSGLTPETTYVYRIRAANSGGESAWTEATVRTPAKPLEVQASVNFVRIDDQTSGLWPLEFGADGTWIASQSSDLPAGIGVTVLPETPVVWAAGSSEARALIGTGGTNRVAAGWSGAPLTLNLSIPRGTPRQIAMYFVDWHRTGASQQVSIRDATTGTNLATRSIEAFGDGKYLVYDIEGNVVVTLNSSEGDAVLSGIFVGEGLPAPISDNPLTFRVLGADPSGMRVRISGDSGQRFKVQRTTDFRTWTDVANSILLSPSTEMTLSGEVTGGFFRTVNTQ